MASMAARLLSVLLLVLACVEGSAMYSNPLGVPARLQWPNAGGYCGETSAQMAALLRGAWISQGAWRAAGGGPTTSKGQLLLTVNLEAALAKMRLTYVRWDQTAAARGLRRTGAPEYAAFKAWMQGQLAARCPVIFGEYVADAGNDPDFDHIVPAVGASSSGDLTFFNLYEREAMVLPWAQLSATRQRCQRDLVEGGCIPSRVDYGTAVIGIADANRATLPVRLAVNRADEPNYSPVDCNDQGEYRTAPQKPVPMNGTVTVSGLTRGRKYRLMRFSTPAKVPTKGGAAAWLASGYDSFVDFMAPPGRKWVYADPRTFQSSATIFYRCVEKLGQ